LLRAGRAQPRLHAGDGHRGLLRCADHPLQPRRRPALRLARSAGPAMNAGKPAIEAPRSLWSDAGHALRRNRAAMTAACVLGLLALLVVFGPALSPWQFDKPDWEHIAMPPTLADGHLFGTDALGRDLL